MSISWTARLGKEARLRAEARLEKEKRLEEEWLSRKDVRQRWLAVTWPETTGRYATAADLPSELFGVIIRNAVSGDQYRDRQKAVAVLCRCALVALPWAKHARAILWGDVLNPADPLFFHYLRKSRDARMLMETTLRSCPRLTPVIDLVTQIRAHLQYVEPSWLHMLTTIPKIRSKLTHVELDGIYMTKGIDRTLLRTPHWGTPFSTASSSPLAHLTEIWLHHIHFDQFSDLARLLRHFVFPNSISMDKLTWGKTDVPLHWPPRSVHGKRSTGIKYISIKDCTDDTLAAIAIHALDARLPIQTLLPHEQLQVQELSQAMHKDLDRRLNTCPVLAPFPSELLGRLLITCSCPEPHKKTQVVGALLILPKTGDIRRFERTALSGFLDSVIKFPGLRAIGVAYFGSPDEPFFSLPEVSASVSGLRPDVVCRLLHSRGQYASELPVWIELEWATKKPTGHVWKCDKLEDKEHQHRTDICQGAILARAMSFAIQEHMRKYRFVSYAATPAVE